MAWKKNLEIAAAVVGVGAAAAGIGEIISQNQRLDALERQNHELRQELTDEEVERCLTDGITYFHDFVLRDALGVGGGQTTVDCSKDFKPRFSPDNQPDSPFKRPIPGLDVPKSAPTPIPGKTM